MSLDTGSDALIMRQTLSGILTKKDTRLDSSTRISVVNAQMRWIHARLMKEICPESESEGTIKNAVERMTQAFIDYIHLEVHLALERRAERLNIGSNDHSRDEYIQMRTQVIQAFTKWCLTLMGEWEGGEEPLNSGDTRVLRQPDVLPAFMDNALLIPAEEQPPVIIRHDFAQGRK